MQVLVNEFCLFRAFYCCHFLHDFHTSGVTFKGKALVTKCIFQNYSQLLDICTRLVLKTSEEVFVPSVCCLYCPQVFCGIVLKVVKCQVISSCSEQNIFILVDKMFQPISVLLSRLIIHIFTEY